MNNEFTIMINNQFWNVKIVNIREAQLSTPTGEFYGICNYDTYEIIIGEMTNKQKMRLIFIHELVHAMLFTHMLEKKKTYSEEDICEFVAKYYQTINNAIQIWDYQIGGQNAI